MGLEVDHRRAVGIMRHQETQDKLLFWKAEGGERGQSNHTLGRLGHAPTSANGNTHTILNPVSSRAKNLQQRQHPVQSSATHCGEVEQWRKSPAKKREGRAGGVLKMGGRCGSAKVKTSRVCVGPTHRGNYGDEPRTGGWASFHTRFVFLLYSTFHACIL